MVRRPRTNCIHLLRRASCFDLRLDRRRGRVRGDSAGSAGCRSSHGRVRDDQDHPIESPVRGSTRRAGWLSHPRPRRTPGRSVESQATLGPARAPLAARATSPVASRHRPERRAWSWASACSSTARPRPLPSPSHPDEHALVGSRISDVPSRRTPGCSRVDTTAIVRSPFETLERPRRTEAEPTCPS